MKQIYLKPEAAVLSLTPQGFVATSYIDGGDGFDPTGFMGNIYGEGEIW